MAEDKKSFIGYVDWGETFEMLDDADAGKLIKHFFRYVSDQDPKIEDKLLMMAFHPIKLQLKRDLVKYENKKQQWVEAGKLSAAKKALKKATDVEIELTESTSVENVPTESTVTVIVNDTVTDNVSVINTPLAPKNKNGWKTMPLPEDVHELPFIKIQSAKELLKITRQVDVSDERIVGMWQVFKIQNLTGEKYYKDVGDTHSHFINWIKKQQFDSVKATEVNHGSSINQRLKTAKSSAA